MSTYEYLQSDSGVTVDKKKKEKEEKKGGFTFNRHGIEFRRSRGAARERGWRERPFQRATSRLRFTIASIVIDITRIARFADIVSTTDACPSSPLFPSFLRNPVQARENVYPRSRFLCKIITSFAGARHRMLYLYVNTFSDCSFFDRSIHQIAKRSIL
jgi:hypothetical protein